MAYTYNDVQVALEEANILPGDTVFLHSSLLDLGKMKDVAPEAAAGKVADAIIDYIGPGGTLVVPAFSWEFYRGQNAFLDFILMATLTSVYFRSTCLPMVMMRLCFILFMMT